MINLEKPKPPLLTTHQNTTGTKAHIKMKKKKKKQHHNKRKKKTIGNPKEPTTSATTQPQQSHTHTNTNHQQSHTHTHKPSNQLEPTTATTPTTQATDQQTQATDQQIHAADLKPRPSKIPKNHHQSYRWSTQTIHPSINRSTISNPSIQTHHQPIPAQWSKPSSPIHANPTSNLKNPKPSTSAMRERLCNEKWERPCEMGEKFRR